MSKYYRRQFLKTNIKDYNLEQLKAKMVELGEKPFRGEQIFEWLYKENVNSFDDMTNLSLQLRDKLKENFEIHRFFFKEIKN
jgi:23S rRNA (adenine2503-C2)-methyltransferase